MTNLRKAIFSGASVVLSAIALLLWRQMETHRDEEVHLENGETELRIAYNGPGTIQLFLAGSRLGEERLVREISGTRDHEGYHEWLLPGNYFLGSSVREHMLWYPVSLFGYRSGPDEDGALVVTIRGFPGDEPPRLLPTIPSFEYVPGGNFLLGDRLNPRERHHVWLTGYFVAPFEVTNEEFRAFLLDPSGYDNDEYWTGSGKTWKKSVAPATSAGIANEDPDFERFGQSDQPVTNVSWFEANAFCKWLTKAIGGGRWLFSLPTDAEWEKAARGADNFDFALGMSLSDNELSLYNWKKNPGAPVTVVGIHASQIEYLPNRYGLFHMTGNVAEWTQSVYRVHNRKNPYRDDERNGDNTPGLRDVRGGSWYSASIANLTIPYRDNFQPEHRSRDIGFRLVGRRLP